MMKPVAQYLAAGVLVLATSALASSPCTVTWEPTTKCAEFDSELDDAGNDFATSCQVLRVACTDPAETDTFVEIMISEPDPRSRAQLRGAIVFGSGGPGARFYEATAPGIAARVLVPMLEEGYYVIQRRWIGGWSSGTHGLKSVSRRGAAMFQWLEASDGARETEYEEFPDLTDLAFCATGNSGGSAELGFGLAYHELENVLDGALLTSGPANADLQRGCWGDNPLVFTPVWFDDTACLRDESPAQADAKRWNEGSPCFDKDGDGMPFEDNDDSLLCGACDDGQGNCQPLPEYEAYEGVLPDDMLGSIDKTYGADDSCNPEDTPLVCPCKDTSLDDGAVAAQLQQLCDDSLVCSIGDPAEPPDYDYPSTHIGFLFGDKDCGAPIPLGLLYAVRVTDASGIASISFVREAGHNMAASTTGGQAIVEGLRLTCHRCEGDANLDGVVDPLDGGYIAARLGCAPGTGDMSCDAADVNGDGSIDPLDLGYVLARFSTCN